MFQNKISIYQILQKKILMEISSKISSKLALLVINKIKIRYKSCQIKKHKEKYKVAKNYSKLNQRLNNLRKISC